MLVRDGKFGKFYSCSDYPICNGSAKIPSGIKCIQCGSDTYVTVFGDEPKLGCLAYPHCKNVMELPPNFKYEWVNPKQLEDNQPKKIKKILDKLK